MGVDFFPCERCSSAICDCGDWISCNEDCGRRWCDGECARADGRKHSDGDDYDHDVTCAFCRNEETDDTNLLTFMLKKHKTTRARVLKEYLKGKK